MHATQSSQCSYLGTFASSSAPGRGRISERHVEFLRAGVEGELPDAEDVLATVVNATRGEAVRGDEQ